jgi:hypothetical protein
MKNILYLTAMVLAMISTQACSYEISEEKMKSLYDSDGAWISFQANDVGKFSAELTKYEKQEDGSILVPFYQADKNGKQIGRVGWVSINCSEETVTDLGAYSNKKFERHLITDGKRNAPADWLRMYYCPVMIDKGKRSLAYVAPITADKKSMEMWVWSIDDLKADPKNANIFKTFLYAISGRDEPFPTNKQIEVEINCRERYLKNLSNNIEFQIDSHEGHVARMVVYTACRFNDLLEMSLIAKEQPSVAVEVIKPAVAETNPVEITPPAITTNNQVIQSSIEDAKVKCKDLGFKPKTEKFGKCVLELMQ